MPPPTVDHILGDILIHDHSEADLGAVLDSRYLNTASNLSDLNNVATARTNLGLVAGGTGDIWVEKAGDTMTGALVIAPTVNSTAIFNIKNQAGASVFNVDTTNGNIGIGTTTSAGRLHINGTANDEQLIVEAHSTQTANILEVHNSSGSKLAFVTPTGKFVSTNIGAGLGGLRADLIEYGNTAGEVLNINRTITSTSVSGNYRGINLLVNSGNIDTGTITALDGLNFQVNAGTTTVTTMKGYNANLTYTAAGTITNAYGFSSQWAFNANATITTLAGFVVEGINATPATVTSAYGLRVNDVYGATNNFAIQTNRGNIVFNEGGDSGTDFRIEGDTEDNLFFVDASEDVVKVGDMDTNYTQFDKTGHVTFTGTAKPWDDLRVEPNVRGTGTNNPTFEQYFTNGSGSRGVYLYSFTDESNANNEKEVFFTAQMPHSWDGGAIYIHVHFTPSATVNSSDIVWGLEYTWAEPTQTFGNTTLVYSSTTLVPDDANITASKHYIAKFSALTPSSSQDDLSSILICRLFRNSSNASDTYTNKVGLLYIDMHYQIARIGSNDEYTP